MVVASRSYACWNWTSYRRDHAAATLEKEFGWRESVASTRVPVHALLPGAILPAKFGIDKRRVHLSDRIRNGEITRDEAEQAMAQAAYSPEELRTESEYVRKKLGFTEEE